MFARFNRVRSLCYSVSKVRAIAAALLAVIVCLASALPTLAQPHAPVPTSTSSSTAPPTLGQRLAWLETRLEKAREEHHVPGMAIAVVQNGKVILLRGFGVAGLDSNRPVTADTRFAVGSTTKAFTATLVGILADEGKMSFDDPVRKHLPAFKLHDAAADEQVQIRDLLSHRSGLAAMTMLWYGTDATRDDILGVLPGAELLHPFRTQFNYCNEGYLAAGVAAANAAGTDWDTLMADRLLRPLGMTSSNTTYGAAQADAEMSLGYTWDKEKELTEHQPMRRVDSVGPAGSINSSVRDMSRWVLLQLGRGEIDGARIISAEQHAKTWEPQIDISGDMQYGLGWFLREWEGKRLIEHAGGIDGFTAEVALLPEQNVGFVLLMNQFGCPLQELSRPLVFRALLGDISEPAESAGGGGAAAEDLGRLTGTYMGTFAHFKGAAFKVTQKDGKLFLDVPGQMNFELLPPDADGKRQFAITDQISVRFNQNAAGEPESLSMYQAGMTFELPREGVVVPAEVQAGEVPEYLGKYHDDKLKIDVTVLIEDGRLAVDVPGQMVYQLRKPEGGARAEGAKWVLRIRDSMWVVFNRDAAGAVESLTFTQDGAEHVLPRLAGAGGAAEERLPTAAEVVAL
ncbi:MAG: beta-lactamase family protein, partial [Phycisphaerales bacterium]|nr:beta-lactamase family protein [Phycisphaerales bacterium]